MLLPFLQSDEVFLADSCFIKVIRDFEGCQILLICLLKCKELWATTEPGQDCILLDSGVVHNAGSWVLEDNRLVRSAQENSWVTEVEIWCQWMVMPKEEVLQDQSSLEEPRLSQKLKFTDSGRKPEWH